MKKMLPAVALRKLTALYEEMQTAYEQTAAELGLTCVNCENNCCTSFFQHHTYIEWAYLRQGLSALNNDQLQACRERSEKYMQNLRAWAEKGRQGSPGIMCPLNEDGLCILYEHRMMICRLHGVPNRVRMPNGETQHFPGCFKSRELTAGLASPPSLDRTNFYRRLADIEQGFLGSKIRTLPRVRLTLAELILAGPPKV